VVTLFTGDPGYGVALRSYFGATGQASESEMFYNRALPGGGPSRVGPAVNMTSLASDQLAAISRLFSSTVIREMARKGKSPLFARLASQSLLVHSLTPSDRVYHLFDSAFGLLKRKGYRDEYIYRAALTNNILFGRHSLNTASMLNEFRVGDCKADLAILNGTATVYEIKSERDSLSRLQRQIASYATVFAQVYVIAADEHVDAVLAKVPPTIGVLRLDHRQYIVRVREAADRAANTSPAAIFDAIRTAEARMILEWHGMTIPTVPNTVLSPTLRKLFVELAPRAAHEGMVRVLKKTRNLLPLSNLVAQLPSSLHAAALSVPIRRLDHARLVAAVNTPLSDAAAWG
jgi:hypothetical protein